MAIDLFGCNLISMGGLKRLKLATRNNLGNLLTYPIDIVLKSGDESIIVLSDDEVNKVITIGTTLIKYLEIPVESVSFVEDETTQRQGRFYKKTLDLTIPKLTILNNNDLKDLLFYSNGSFDANQSLIFIQDMNDNYWIAGWDIPFSLESFDLTTDAVGGENKYIFQYVSNSYQRVRQYELI